VSSLINKLENWRRSITIPLQTREQKRRARFAEAQAKLTPDELETQKAQNEAL
jgi:hypothetical protein